MRTGVGAGEGAGITLSEGKCYGYSSTYYWEHFGAQSLCNWEVGGFGEDLQQGP